MRWTAQRTKRDLWNLRAGDLPSSALIAREPCLQGMETNPVYRFFAWLRKRKKPIFGSAPTFQLERLVEDLWLSGVTPGAFAAGLWGAYARSSKTRFLLLQSSAAMLLSFLWVWVNPTPPGAMPSMPRLMLLLTLWPAVPVIFGFCLGGLCMEPYLALTLAWRGMRVSRIHFSSPIVSMILTTLMIAPLYGGLAFLYGLSRWMLWSRISVGAWLADFVMAVSELELLAIAALALFLVGFVCAAVPLAVVRIFRRQVFIGVVRDATKIYQLWLESNERPKPSR